MLLRPLKIFEIRLESAVLLHNSGGDATVRALRAEAAGRGPSPISPSWLPVWTKDGCPRMSMHDLSEGRVQPPVWEAECAAFARYPNNLGYGHREIHNFYTICVKS